MPSKSMFSTEKESNMKAEKAGCTVGWLEREEDYLYSSVKALYTNVHTFFLQFKWYD